MRERATEPPGTAGVAPAAWEYVHVCVDDHSRAAYGEVLPNERAVAERLIQILTRGWADGATYHTLQQRTAALRPWLADYSRERPHASLNHYLPISRLTTTREQPA